MAAGLGFKTFTTGEVLTAADVNGYLMQGVLVFASAAARNAAITSPQEGQFAFTKDTNGLWYYDGAAWVASGATGDIEGVTAGVGITGGGTSGTVTITNDMATTITAAGDIVVGTGSGTYDNLPIGTTAQVLTADTTVSPYKVKWATPASSASGLTFISKTDYTAQNTVNINSVFTSTYTNYYIVMNSVSTTATQGDLSFRLRASGTDTSTNYKSQRLYASGASSGAGVDVLGTDEIWFSSGSATGNAPQGTSFVLMSPNEAKSTTMQGSVSVCLNGSNITMDIVSGFQSSATQFDGITFNFSQTTTGSIYIYGLQKA